MSWLSGRKFLVLLAALLLLVVVYPVVHEAGLPYTMYDALFTLVFVAAFVVIFPAGRLRLPALLLGTIRWEGQVISSARVNSDP
jgi:hypothetical protein